MSRYDTAEPYLDAEQKLLSLVDVRYSPEEIAKAIDVLESLGNEFREFPDEANTESWTGMAKEDFTGLICQFESQLTRIRQNEGEDADATKLSLKTCKRLAGLLVLLMFDYCAAGDPETQISDEMWAAFKG